jgi:ABC-type sugar transport system ATPase subunit
MVSSEVDELVEVTDRVLIFRDQTVSSELERGAMSRESLIAGFFGEEPRQ